MMKRELWASTPTPFTTAMAEGGWGHQVRSDQTEKHMNSNTQNMQLISRVNDSDTMGVLSLINENYPRTVFIVILFKVINFKGKVIEATRRLTFIFFFSLTHGYTHIARAFTYMYPHKEIGGQRD